MSYRLEAIDAAGKAVIDVIQAGSPLEAAEQARQRGLFVMKVAECAHDTEHPGAGPSSPTPLSRGKARLKHLVFFTQQMSMLMRSGARVVPSLEAIETQTTHAAMRQMIRAVREEVEGGRPLSDALRRFPELFSEIVINMIAAGEATGDMGLAFERVAVLTRQLQEVRNRVIGAMTYPAVLVLLCINVIVVMLTFILPRFKEMFQQLDVELPFMTVILLRLSDGIQSHWAILLIGIVSAVVGGLSFVRSERGARLWSRAVVRLPIFGVLVRRIILARICRVWGQLLESKVPLLEAVRLTRESTRSLDFLELLDRLEESISSGRQAAAPLRESWLLPSTFAAAIAMGEESGKISASLSFVASCLEEENSQVLSSLSKIIEPIMLVIMGVIVGVMAVSLFLPMFEMAAAPK